MEKQNKNNKKTLARVLYVGNVEAIGTTQPL